MLFERRSKGSRSHRQEVRRFGVEELSPRLMLSGDLTVDPPHPPPPPPPPPPPIYEPSS
jgi:hypothetical protein